MGKVWWAIMAVLVVCQMVCGLELMELSSLVKQVASVDLQTALTRQEAAQKELENARIQNTYYRVLVQNGPFQMSPEEVGEVIKNDVRALNEKNKEGKK